MALGYAPSLPVYSRHRHRDGVEVMVVSGIANGNDGAAASVPVGRVTDHHGGQVSRPLETASGQGVGKANGCAV